MKNSQIHPISIKYAFPWDNDITLFLEANGKIFGVQLEKGIKEFITICNSNRTTPLPLRHEMTEKLMYAFGINVKKAVIVKKQFNLFLIRFFLEQSNELGTKIAEIEAYPSQFQLLMLTICHKLFILNTVLKQLDDISDFYKDIIAYNADNQEED